jgi:hypothetical protein
LSRSNSEKRERRRASAAARGEEAKREDERPNLWGDSEGGVRP